MAEALTEFNKDIEERIIKQRYEGPHASAELQDSLAQEVVDNGGYCDELVFATAFFGGIDAGMKWSNPAKNKELTVKTPAEFKAAQRVADVLRYSVFEPYAARFDESLREQTANTGIVMPGDANFDAVTTGYRIEEWTGGYTGTMVFNSLIQRRLDRHYAQRRVFHIARRQERTETTEVWAEDVAIFGVAAARRHSLGEHMRPSHDNLERVDTYLQGLQAYARGYQKARELETDPLYSRL